MLDKIKSVKQKFGIVGNSDALTHAIQVAIQVAPTDMTVLINGESGTGKESFSKIIHSMSKRKHGEFIAVNCGAIPEGTIDSELFGHEKGSFTGANEARKGYFEVTDGGTIFLDEIIKKQNIHSLERNQLRINNDYKVLIEGYSKKSKNFLKGRTSENKMVIFPKKDRLLGDYVDVKIKDCNSATLFGELC